MTAAALTGEQAADLPRALKGNICRCTGYGSIADAVTGTARIIVPNGGVVPVVGTSLPAPAGPDVVTGRARFTADLAPGGVSGVGEPGDGDVPPEPPLHMKLLRSPHAARVDPVDRGGRGGAAARRGRPCSPTPTPPPGGSPRARHHNPDDDPYDTLVLDRTVRFAGQRVAAVVADTVATAEAACALISVDYDVLPAVTDPAAAVAAGAPALHPDLAPRNIAARAPPPGRGPRARVRRGRPRSTSRPSACTGCSMCTWRRTPRSAGWTAIGSAWCSGRARRRRS